MQPNPEQQKSDYDLSAITLSAEFKTKKENAIKADPLTHKLLGLICELSDQVAARDAARWSDHQAEIAKAGPYHRAILSAISFMKKPSDPWVEYDEVADHFRSTELRQVRAVLKDLITAGMLAEYNIDPDGDWYGSSLMPTKRGRQILKEINPE